METSNKTNQGSKGLMNLEILNPSLGFIFAPYLHARETLELSPEFRFEKEYSEDPSDQGRNEEREIYEPKKEGEIYQPKKEGEILDPKKEKHHQDLPKPKYHEDFFPDTPLFYN